MTKDDEILKLRNENEKVRKKLAISLRAFDKVTDSQQAHKSGDEIRDYLSRVKSSVQKLN